MKGSVPFIPSIQDTIRIKFFFRVDYDRITTGSLPSTVFKRYQEFIVWQDSTLLTSDF